MDIFSSDIRLVNEILLLRPSVAEDVSSLFALADPSIWAESSTSIYHEEDMGDYLQNALDDRQSGIRQQFTIIVKDSMTMIGCSSFENISTHHGRLEIGWTWLGKAFQGKGLNRVAKYLMLKYVFEHLDYHRVEFRTRGTNLQSQRALKKIGAIYEGSLRSYFMSEEKRHDMVYFSILSEEWEMLKKSTFADLCS